MYGSVEGSSFSHYPNDSKDELVGRLNRFFPAYFRYLHADSATIRKVYLEVWRYDRKYVPVQKCTLGHYDVSSRKFLYTWISNP